MQRNDKQPAPALSFEAHTNVLAQLAAGHDRDPEADARRYRNHQRRVVRKAIAPQDEGFDRAVRLIEDNDFGELVV